MKRTFFLIWLLAVFNISKAQFEPNYDESKIPAFKLPDVLTTLSGKQITSAEEWNNIRRPEILGLFEMEMYGRSPDKKIDVTFNVLEDNLALDGIARRKQIRILFSNNDKELAADLLVYLPVLSKGPAPLFIGYNFSGNHTIIPDPAINISQNWVRDNSEIGIFNNIADELSRGANTSRWPVLYILSRGYGVAVLYYGDVDPDYDDGFQNGIHPLFYTSGQTKPKPEEWGSIGAWAYGLSTALDYFERDDAIDHRRIAVIGHSRLGKTSMWAGAVDQRFALVISNESGCGGAALSRRRFGETVERINTSFPHWFCDNFKMYNKNEDSMPFDQHMLIALIAPRPVYIASAQGDQWADPKGEFLSAYYANPVYRLFGFSGIPDSNMPEVNKSIGEGHIGYHIRTGEHDLTYYDWLQFLNFADRHLK